jgi:hypothetical protein
MSEQTAHTRKPPVAQVTLPHSQLLLVLPHGSRHQSCRSLCRGQTVHKHKQKPIPGCSATAALPHGTAHCVQHTACCSLSLRMRLKEISAQADVPLSTTQLLAS